MGGIMTAEDVIDFLSAGASAVAVGTANFVIRLFVRKLIEELPVLLKRLGYNHISECTGRSWNKHAQFANHRA